jgi:hypothetical protein
MSGVQNCGWTIRPWKVGQMAALVIIISGAEEQEAAAELAGAPGRLHRHRPQRLVARPGGGHHLVAIADVPIDPEFAGGILQIA